MKNALALTLLALVATACITETRSQGDPIRYEYPPYDGPRLSVWVHTFENKAENPAYSELGDVAADVLSAELSRSGAIQLQNRKDLGALATEARLQGTDIVPNDTDCMIKGVVVNYGVKEETAGFLVYNKKQVVQCEIQIEIVNRHTGASTMNYGQATTSVDSTSGLGAGTTTTYDRTLAKKALRAAIGDCWTQMMQSLRAVNPGRPAGE